MTDQPRYIQVPLFLLNNIEKDLCEIFDYGIYLYAKQLKLKNMSNVFRQVMYLYYHDKIGPCLKKKLDVYIIQGELTPQRDYKGFNTGDREFDSELQIEELRDICLKDAYLNEDLILYSKLKKAFEFLAVDASYETIIKNGKEYDTKRAVHEKQYGGQPIAMFNLKILWQFYKSEKTPYEQELLKAYLAIKSLIGKESFAETTQAAIAMRMIGAKDENVLADFLKTNKNKALYEKYCKRYHIEKLFDNLLGRGFIKSKFSFGRRTYISTTLSFVELPKAVFEKKLKRNGSLKHLENQKKERSARTQYQKLINNTYEAKVKH